MKPTILFVDDELGHRKLFLKAIDQNQFNVLLADTAESALQQLGENTEICVLITDYNMPIKNGLQLLEEAAQEWPQIARIMCTAISDLDVAKNAINQGKVSAYFNKPWDIDELNQKILEGIAIYQENKLHQQLKNINDLLKDEDDFKELLFKSNFDQISDFCNTVEGVVNHLLDGELDPERRLFLDMAVVASKISLFRAANLLDYCRIKNNDFSLNCAEISSHELADQLVEDFRILFEDFQGYFQINIDEFLLTHTVHLDQDRLYRMLAGIISYCSSVNGDHKLLLSMQQRTDADKPNDTYLLIELSCHAYAVSQITKFVSVLGIDKKTALQKNHSMIGSELDLFISNELAKQMNSAIVFKVEPNGKVIFSLMLNAT